MTSYRDWVLSEIRKGEDSTKIKQITSIGDEFLEIISQKGHHLVVGFADSKYVSSKDVQDLLATENQPHIIIAPYKSIWSGSAINYARQQNLGWGGIGELTRAIDSDDVAAIQKKEYEFVESGLNKHTKVQRLEREFDRVFTIHRINGLSPLKITLINEYELTADHVTHASEIYGSFDIVLKTNPNGNITGMAEMAAEHLSVKICSWRGLLGRLNKR